MNKHKMKKSTAREKSTKDISAEGAPAPLSAGPLVGIIGWNSPRFLEFHAGFIDALKNTIAGHGCRPVFLGVSGSADNLRSNGFHHLKISGENGANGHSIVHYGLPSRDIIADQIEMIVQEEHLDGLVMIPWSVNALVGMMMASARCGVPTLVLPHYSAWPELAVPADPKEKSQPVYTQWSMLALAEAMGLAKLGTLDYHFRKDKSSQKPAAPPAGAVPAEVFEGVKWGGQRIAEMSKQKISQKRFFSQASFHNALCVDMALGSSTDAVLHLTAVAYEAGVPLPLSAFNDAAAKVPQLVPFNKEGEVQLEEFAKLGGLPALLSALSHTLQASPTVLGKNIFELAKEMSYSRSPFKMDHPVKKQRGLAIISGNLAREGAIFRASGLKDASLAGSGPVRVFNSETECVDAVLAKKIKKGDVLALRYCGPRGSPGMPRLASLAKALDERGLDDSIMILTDGRLQLPGHIPAIVHISPEAAIGSALSILQDGDVVLWSFADKYLTVRLTETEIKVRLSRWKAQDKIMKNTFLYRYSKYSSSSSYGAKLV